MAPVPLLRPRVVVRFPAPRMGGSTAARQPHHSDEARPLSNPSRFPIIRKSLAGRFESLIAKEG